LSRDPHVTASFINITWVWDWYDWEWRNGHVSLS
jgi:hypothetical protein